MRPRAHIDSGEERPWKRRTNHSVLQRRVQHNASRGRAISASECFSFMFQLEADRIPMRTLGQAPGRSMSTMTALCFCEISHMYLAGGCCSLEILDWLSHRMLHSLSVLSVISFCCHSLLFSSPRCSCCLTHSLFCVPKRIVSFDSVRDYITRSLSFIFDSHTLPRLVH